MNIFEKAVDITTKQQQELTAMVPDSTTRIVIARLMQVILLGFTALTKDQMRLVVKFTIESIEEIEEIEDLI